MSSRGKINVAGILLTLAVIAFYGVLQWQANPQMSQAVPPEVPNIPPWVTEIDIDWDPDDGGGGSPEPVAASIIFVIDGSQHMFPRIGPNYFDMAKDAIEQLIGRRGFRTDGRNEIGIVQFTEMTAPGYDDDTHWVRPLRIMNKADHDHLLFRVRTLERSTHHTASLLEIGIREATELLMTDAATTGQKHIILLTTGEYRLPTPCPPDCFSHADPNCTWSCDAPGIGFCNAPEPDKFCMRACPIRHFAALARINQYKISAIQLGPDWFNNDHPTPSCREINAPYGSPPVYCGISPNQPDRTGLLNEISNVGDCAPGEPVGKYARVKPALGFGCTGDCTPGTSDDIRDTLIEWFCEWQAYNPALNDPDGDSFFDICDNCPNTANEHQRDCDRDGIGDLCQFSHTACGAGTVDEDCDGIVDLVGGLENDICLGGDDCLVAEWVEARGCDFADYPDDCWYDCDNNDIEDACSEARAVTTIAGEPAGTTWPLSDVWAHRDADTDGVMDCCQEPRFTCDGATASDCYSDFDSNCCEANPAFCDCDPHPKLCDVPDFALTNPVNGMVEAFNVCEGNCPTNFFPAFESEQDEGVFNNQGWRLAAFNSSTVNAVTVEEETDVETGDVYRFLRIGTDLAADTSGASGWTIDGPGYYIPLGDCFVSHCSPAEAQRIPWGMYAIEISLRIHHDPSAVCSSGTCIPSQLCDDDEHPCVAHGATYEIIISDPQIEDPFDARRIHLRLRPDFKYTNVHGGEWYIEKALWSGFIAGMPTAQFDPINKRTFAQDEWFKIKFTFNVSDAYDYYSPYGCLWNGKAGTDTTRYFRQRSIPPNRRMDDRTTTGQGDLIDELGRSYPETAKGLQLQIRTNNFYDASVDENGNPFVSRLDIGDVSVYPVSIREAGFGEYPPCNPSSCTECNDGFPPCEDSECPEDCCEDISPCVGPECPACNPCCGCTFPICGDCKTNFGSTNSCGSLTLEPGFGEQCEVPWPSTLAKCVDSKGCHCDKECLWQCGDGIVQSNIDANNNGIYDHCEEMGWPLNLCGEGTEECDDGNSVNTDACTNNCTLP